MDHQRLDQRPVRSGALHTHTRADSSVVFADISPIAQVLNIKSLQVTIARYYEKNILGMNTTFWTFVIAIDIAYLLCLELHSFFLPSFLPFFLSFVPSKKEKGCTISPCFQIRPDSARRFLSPMHAPTTQLADYLTCVNNRKR